VTTRRAGFTLIEMIAALGIAAVVMTLVAFHVVTIAGLWLNRTDDDFLDHHVEGVVSFLQGCFNDSEAALAFANRSASGTASSSPGTGGAGTSANPAATTVLPVEWHRPPGWSDFDAPLLRFRQREAPAILVREGQRLPAILAWLHFEPRAGLSLIWYSQFESEEPTERDNLFITLLSPLVSAVEYAAYNTDTERWEIDDKPQELADQSLKLPQFLRLTFTHDDETRQRIVAIPPRSSELPLF
jgi:prepilin-type N-terminal cleavage/methylation domain-containing protein